jgi:uroporphyrinogen-III decarboxylase
MDRQLLLDLAARGARFPIGTDLVLHEHADASRILHDGKRLGQVFETAARRYNTPLAIPLMDLTLEKQELLKLLEVSAPDPDTFHFDQPPPSDAVERLHEAPRWSSRMSAHLDAIRYIARETTLVPVGMCIGPFSLATKLLADPITPVFLAGSGSNASDDEEVARLEAVVSIAQEMVLRSIEAQLDAGAVAMFIAEPAANKVYFSPKQLESGSDIFDRYAMTGNRRLVALLQSRGASLLFHCCGELIDPMVSSFASLQPALLSLGSSRRLWEDAKLVPDDIVLYGNLPTKKFFSDSDMPESRVLELTGELLREMKRTNHPFILGSECDVLSVKGCEQTIKRKLDAALGLPG